jgi:hypothetical protein
MPWFNFFRRGVKDDPPAKPPWIDAIRDAQANPDSQPLSESVEQVEQAFRTPKVRPEHYYFAHVKLRSFAFAEPEQCFGVLHSEGATAFLSKVWYAVKDGATFSPSDAALRFEDLKIHRRTAGIYPSVVIEMPQAKFPPEAHFVALVWQVMGVEGVMIKRTPELLYYTLESARPVAGMQRTMFCEWRGETHLNLGDGPAPELEAFVTHVDNRVMANLSRGRSAK